MSNNLFKGLKDEIIKLNNSAKTVANCEKAKRMRAKLLAIGLSMAIVGFIGVITCFVLFVTAGAKGFSQNGFSPRIIIPFVLFLPCGAIASIGSAIASLGFKILVTGYTTNLIDETVGNNCPNCGDVIDDEEFFCSKCGTQLKIECPNCKTINSLKNTYCTKCGKEL